MNSSSMAGGSGAIISAMLTPALFILGSASLVASALVRMARVVDRARALATMAFDEGANTRIASLDTLARWLHRHRRRADQAEGAIQSLYVAIVLFISTCLSIALDDVLHSRLGWVPVLLAVAGTVFLLVGGSYMVVESRLSSRQINEEIAEALVHLRKSQP